ncbi:hypothetical protein HUS23_07960 [Ectothiorhodospiraceae bacterium 2226]|nr:hypothetical protein HUS23_07960 [Ectothiorhodospiraceae bacterium 2226]
MPHSNAVRPLAVLAMVIVLSLTSGCAGFGEFMTGLAEAMEQQAAEEAPRRSSDSSAAGIR